MANTKRLRAVERDRGADASIAANGAANPLSFLASSFDDVERAYQGLDSKDARREFFESGLTRIDRNLPGSWARLYWFIDLCRREEWFWEEKGYGSFEAYWRKQGRFAFSEITKLETMFHFAKTACPRLFDFTKEDAERLWRWTARLSAAARQGSPRSKRVTKNDHARDFSEVDYDTQSEDFKRGYQAHCGKGAVSRFRRLKRHAPAIAQELLEGKFVKTVKGQPRPDLAAAEKKAGIFADNRGKAAPPAGQRLAPHVSKLSAADLNDMWSALDGPTKRRLRALLRRV